MLLSRRELIEIGKREMEAEQMNPGPWSGDCVLFDRKQKELLFDARTGSMGVKSVPVARFIAEAKTDVPRLLDHIYMIEKLCPWIWIWRGIRALKRRALGRRLR